LVCGAAAAIVLAAATHPAGWPAAIALTLAGIAAQLSPFAPLDPAKASPVPLLFGLLVIGPALIALAVPHRILPWTTALGGIELAAAVLPALLLGIPATRGISVIALNLGESGLALGPKLTMQRPKVVLGFVLALIAAAVVAVLGRLLAHRVPRVTRWPSFAEATTTRIAGGVIVAAALGALILSGALADAETQPILTLAVASVLAALAAWFGLELAPLVTGLVLGQLMQAPLRAVGKAGGLDAAMSGSKPLLVLAVAATGLALAWPLVAARGWRGGRAQTK
jgi:TctA family transporter